MNSIELKLISELMKNSRRSDRELAKSIGKSQPTVTRIRSRLEKEGYIKEYTMLPDLSRIGFEILAITFAKLIGQPTREDLEKARKTVREVMNKESSPVILGMRGIGLDADRVIISLHEDYSAYDDFINFIKSQPLVKVNEVKSYLISLNDKDQFLPLSFSALAGYVLRSEKPSVKRSKLRGTCRKEQR